MAGQIRWEFTSVRSTGRAERAKWTDDPQVLKRSKAFPKRRTC
jgi:hypothetical protein